MGFLKFCSVLLNMVCGYPIGKDCVVCSGSLAFGCVFGFGLLGLVYVVGMGYFCMLLATGGSGNIMAQCSSA